MQTSAGISPLEGHTKSVYCVAWSPSGGQIASGSADKTALIWDASSGRKVAELRGHTGFVRGVAWNPNSRQIATASDDTCVRIFDTGSGSKVN